MTSGTWSVHGLAFSWTEGCWESSSVSRCSRSVARAYLRFDDPSCWSIPGMQPHRPTCSVRRASSKREKGKQWNALGGPNTRQMICSHSVRMGRWTSLRSSSDEACGVHPSVPTSSTHFCDRCQCHRSTCERFNRTTTQRRSGRLWTVSKESGPCSSTSMVAIPSPEALTDPREESLSRSSHPRIATAFETTIFQRRSSSASQTPKSSTSSPD